MSPDCCYLCNECPTSFSSMDDLEAHLRAHVSAKSLVPQSQNNEDHDMAQQHSPSSSEVSERTSREGERAGEDERAEDGDTDVDMEDSMMDLKPGYHCRFCHIAFDDQSQLNVHYTHTHRDKPQYECDVCHTVFAVKRELSTHMRIHSGEQPHKCEQCGKEFGTRQLLKKHWMWHTGERSHVCKHCNKAFFQKGHLTQHLMIHSGGRPHQCQLCQKTFIFKFDLNRHMKIHAERGFACNQCGRSFQRQLSLDEHSLKCKGKSPASVAPSQPRSPAVVPASRGIEMPQPSFPLIAPSILNSFTQEQMAKMAQSLFAQQQQRALSVLLAPQAPVAPAPSTSFCVLCSQHFPSQQLFALHMYTNHVQPSMAKDENMPSNISSLFTPMNPIKTEDEEEHVIVHSETATNSSCASSPQKPSPISEQCHISPSPYPVMTSLSSEATPTLPLLAASSPRRISDQQDCSDCHLHKNRSDELEQALREKANELQKYKEMMKAVVSTAGQLLSQCNSENLFIAHTKNIFSQLHNTLLTNE